MDFHGDIIALLQGELRDPTEARNLLRSLCESSDGIDSLLKHIDMRQRLSRLRSTVPAVGSSSLEQIERRIEQFEQSGDVRQTDRSKSVGAILPASGTEAGKGTTIEVSAINIGLFLLSLLVTVGIGYLIGIYSAAVSRNSAGATPDTIRPVFGSEHVLLDDLVDQEDGYLRVPAIETDMSMDGQVKQLIESEMNRRAGQNGRSETQREIVGERTGTNDTVKVPAETAGLRTGTVKVMPYTVLSPSGGEEFGPGDVIPILWEPSMDSTPVVIEFSRDGGGTWFDVVRDFRGDRFLWRIPDTVETGDTYLIRISPIGAPDDAAYLERIVEAAPDGITLDISPDGSSIATAGRDALVRIADFNTGRLLTTLEGHQASIQSCRYSRDGSKLVTTDLDGIAIVWDVATGELLHRFDAGLGANVWWATFDPAGTTVVTCHNEGTVVFWDVRSGSEIRRYRPHEEAVRYAAYSSDGSMLLTSSTDRTAAIIDPETLTIRQRFIHHPSKERVPDAIVNGITVNRTGTVAMTCGHDGFVRYWNIASGELLDEQKYLDGAEVGMIRLTNDRQFGVLVGSNGVSLIIDAQSGLVIARLAFDDGDQPAQMIHAAFTPDGTHVAISHMDGQVSIWKIDIPRRVSHSFWSVRE